MLCLLMFILFGEATLQMNCDREYTWQFFALFIFREKAKKIFNSLRKKRKMRKSILLVNIPQKIFLKIFKLFKKIELLHSWEKCFIFTCCKHISMFKTVGQAMAEPE